MVDFYHPQHSCGKLMFSQACVKNSVHRRGCVSHACCPPGHECPQAHMPPGHAHSSRHAHLWAHMPPGTHTPTMHTPQILRDAVNERAVRILLEYILVMILFRPVTLFPAVTICNMNAMKKTQLEGDDIYNALFEIEEK